MVELKTKLFPKTVANKIIEAYADRNELHRHECTILGIEDSCSDLMRVLNGDGYLDADERSFLEERGYSKRFVSALFGEDGGRAIRERIDASICDLPEMPREEGRIFLTISALKLGPTAMPWLIDALERSHGTARANVAFAIGIMGSYAKPAVPALIDALSDEADDVRAEAALALGAAGPAATEAFPKLIAALNDDNTDVRINAVNALGNIAPITSDAVEHLIGVMAMHRDYLGDCAARTLANIYVKLEVEGADPALRGKVYQEISYYCAERGFVLTVGDHTFGW